MILTAKKRLAEALVTELQRNSISENEVLDLLEIPKLYEHGHLALPLFSLAKRLKKNPIPWTQELADIFSKMSLDFVVAVKPVGGFLNFTLKTSFISDLLYSSLLLSDFYQGESGKGKTVVIDYSSPNVAKPLHVGNMRATIVGQAIRNLAETQKYKVVGVNHIGDWGTQFGKLCWAYINWGQEYDFSSDPIDSLLKLYVRFNEEAQKNSQLEEAGAETFKKLEEKDPQITAIWKMIVELSMKDFESLYSIMKVRHEVVLGESFYNDKMDDVIHRLQAKNLLQTSEGAQVVFFDEKDNMPPCIIKKSDGASIYATRDLAAAIYRHEVQKGDLLLYVVGVDQTLHFKQVFSVLKKLGYVWAQQCHHISFGRYRFKDGKMSTRSGKVVFAKDVLKTTFEVVKTKVQEKNPTLASKDEVIWQVAVAAVFFNDLMNDRVKDVEFDWDRITSTDGDSGPHVQYTGVRCKSILRKYGRPAVLNPPMILESVEEQKLMFTLLRFAEVLEMAFIQFRPNIVAQYLLELCAQFGQFYHKCRILGEEKNVESSRIALVAATEKVLAQGLKVLNIDLPEEM